MGTPEFAVPSLAGVYDHHAVTAVVTQPDRPKGRGRQTVPSPVKAWAVERGLPVLQPEKVRDRDFQAELSQYPADMFVVVAYGQILPPRLLRLPQLGCVNVHASLLPKYRGASPMQWAIVRGETVTGVTIQHMDKGVDTGDMILQKSLPIGQDDTFETLHDKLAPLGAEALLEALTLLENGVAPRIPQNPDEATHAPLLTRETGRVDWSKPAAEIRDLARGLNPWPGAFTEYQGETWKIWVAEVREKAGEPGEILEAPKGSLIVGAGQGSLSITELQAGNGKRMPAAAYLLGHRVEVGDRLR